MKRLLWITPLLLLLLTGCEGEGEPRPTVNELLRRYDIALLELHSNPAADMQEFEEKNVWPYLGPGTTLLLRTGIARYIVGVEAVMAQRNDVRWQTDWNRILALRLPGIPSTMVGRTYQEILDKLEARRMGFSEAFAALDAILKAQLVR